MTAVTPVLPQLWHQEMLLGLFSSPNFFSAVNNCLLNLCLESVLEGNAYTVNQAKQNKKNPAGRFPVVQLHVPLRLPDPVEMNVSLASRVVESVSALQGCINDSQEVKQQPNRDHNQLCLNWYHNTRVKIISIQKLGFTQIIRRGLLSNLSLFFLFFFFVSERDQFSMLAIQINLGMIFSAVSSVYVSCRFSLL